MTSRKLLWRFVAIFTTFAVIIIIFIGLVLNITVQTSYYNSFRQSIESGLVLWGDYRNFQLDNMAETSVYEISRLLKDENDGKNFFNLVKSTRTFILMEAAGKTVVQSDHPLFSPAGDNRELLLSVLSSRNALDAMAGMDRGDDRRLIRDGTEVFFDYTVRLELREGSYILYFRYDREEWLETINSINQNILTSLLAAVFLSIGLGLIMSRAVTEPLVRIRDKAREIAAGNFDVNLTVSQGDEIGELTRTFNHMAVELNAMMVAVSGEKNKMETLLNYMTDGVIAFDPEGRIIHVNPAAGQMLEITPDMRYDDFAVRNGIPYGLSDLLGTTGKPVAERTIRSGERYIRTLFAVYSDRETTVEGIMVVLQDITEHERIDRMRKEFVENVSHELKTPLATISSYVETLLDGAADDRETAYRFMGVIQSEADRMARLVKDLLLLSSIDYLRSGGKSITLEKRRISIADLAVSCTERLRLEALHKGQTLTCLPGRDSPYILADRDRMEQVVMNLIGNAVKYTPEGGSVTVTTGTEGGEAWLRVADTGIGIPENELGRIFERFARVDKARSREMGGTGLGLAIAREIVDLHGGTIDISSRVGEGTVITVRLPIGEILTRISRADPLFSRADPLFSRADPLVSRADPLFSRADPLVSRADPLVSRADPLDDEVSHLAEKGDHTGHDTPFNRG